MSGLYSHMSSAIPLIIWTFVRAAFAKKGTYSAEPGPIDPLLFTQLIRNRINDRFGEQLARQNSQDAFGP